MQDYDEFFNGVVYRVQPEAGYLQVAGPDRAAFLQRQTTNDIDLRRAGQALPTVLVSPTARILDVLTLLPEEERAPDIFCLLTLPGLAKKTFQFFKSRIFFMDKVSLSNDTPSFTQADLMGSQAQRVLQALGLPNPLAENELASIDVAGSRIQVLEPMRSLGSGCRLVIPAEAAGQVFEALTSQGAVPLSDQSYEILRIEAGLPAAGIELSEEYTPLEMGLEGAISSTKGCYTGQEIIARQVNYDKITRRMVGLCTARPVQPGDQVLADGKPVGAVTSAVESPRLGPLALAVVKRPHFEPGEILQVAGEVSPRVAALPFAREEIS